MTGQEPLDCRLRPTGLAGSTHDHHTVTGTVNVCLCKRHWINMFP